TQTYTGGTRSPFTERGPQRDDSTAITVMLRHSMVLLPDKPMIGRLADSRVGFFETGFFQFGGPENRVEEVAFANRWRLEKKDPSAALSEPVKPITYYISPELPEKWHPYIKQGVEDWNIAFEKAGFKNGIVCKEVPTEAEDPEFDEDDVRYSVIRWLPSTTENAYGPSIVDPRSGEILNANPKFFHNILKLVENWYFVQASPNDKAARKLPLPESHIGALLRYVVAHEIGHTLGLQHNMRASSAISIAQLRNPKWTSQWGTEASIMDYGRMNYVAQPGDGVTRLIPKIAPYDLFAIEWGYGIVPGAATSEAEKPALDRIASRQIKEPMLRFGDADPLEDPHRQTEDLGSDPIAATALGLKNLNRVLSYIVPATSKPGEDYERLQEVYNTVLGQRQTELNHVVAMVGGVVQTNYHYQRGGSAVYEPVPAAKQKEAVQFLLQNGFATPTMLLKPEITSRLEAGGVTNRVLNSQVSLLARLLVDSRLVRMTDQQVLAKGQSKPMYTMAAMMEDVRHGIFSELGAPKVTVDPIRRNLQRTYISLLAPRLAVPNSDVRPIARKCLMDTQASLKAALPKAVDPATRAHLIDCNEVLQQILYPTKS
ncbi:MAG: zinc-dependent metalloprotease, partial [Armatimonadota bacterium]